jgi:hypothetical protein
MRQTRTTMIRSTRMGIWMGIAAVLAIAAAMTIPLLSGDTRLKVAYWLAASSPALIVGALLGRLSHDKHVWLCTTLILVAFSLAVILRVNYGWSPVLAGRFL